MAATNDQWLQISQIAEGLWRVDEGGFVSWYVVRSPDESVAAAIDCGWGLTPVRATVATAVDASLNDLFLTHVHPDHHGAADEFQRSVMSRTEWQQHGRSWNLGTKKIATGAWQPHKIFEDLPAYRPYPEDYVRADYDQRVASGVPEPTLLVDDGQQLVIAGRAAEVILTPGHSIGHVSYYFPEEQWLFSGDALIPQQWWWHLRCRSSIAAGLKGLLRLQDILQGMPQEGIIWPCHGQPWQPISRDEAQEIITAAVALLQNPVPGFRCRTPVGDARRHTLLPGLEWLFDEGDWLAWCEAQAS